MWRYLFSFEGRINRAKVWLFVAGLILAEGAIAIVARLALWIGDALDTGQAMAISDDIVMLLVYVFGAAANVALLSVAVRRMHDANRSGWFLLAYPLVGAICALQSDATPMQWIVGTAMLLLFLFVMFVLPGTDGPNRFGPDPLAQ